MSETLEVRLLGAPELLRDGEPLRFDTRKAVALVAYLAVTGRRHTREDLAALLWPESDRTRSRSALRRTLSTAGAVGPALVVDRAGVSLGPSVRSDVVAFADAVAAGLEGAPDAVRLYRGDFLEGFSVRDSAAFEDWRAGVSERLRRDLDGCLALLVDRAVTAGDLTQAIASAQRRLELDSLNEAAHQSLIALYDWSGRRSDSLRQYRRCVRVLERELGVAPLPETTAVYDAVRRRRLPRPGSLEVPTGQPEAGRAQGPAAPTRREVPDTVFVGRDRELAALEAAWDAARRSGQAVALVGEVGSGKTSLLSVLGHRLQEQGARLLVVRGHEGEQDLAYGTATDLVRALAEVEPATAAEPVAADRSALRWLLPADDASDADGTTPAHRARVFDAVRSLLAKVAETSTGGVLLGVEDTHWLDPESRDLVAYLVRRPVAGVLLAPTWRGASSPPGVAAAMADAMVDGTGDVIRLTGLSRDEVGAVLAAYGRNADDQTVDDVVLHTGGLPLLVQERATVDPGAGDGWPEGDRLVRARVDAAPETTRQVVATVAVVAAPMDPDLLRAVSGRSDQEVVAALEDAVARGLLVELPGRAEYELPHDTLRRLVVERTSLARRRLLHSRAADALSGPTGGRAERGPGWPGSVARHLELAGRGLEAATWHVRAAEQAQAVFAHATAESHWSAALALGHDPQLCHLGIGDARVRLGRYADALLAFERAAAETDDDAALATIEHRLADVQLRLGEPALAQAHLESALELSTGSGETALLRALVLADLALVALRLDRLDEARSRADAAVTAAADVADATAGAQAANVLGVLASRAGDVAAARAHLASSVAQVQQLADPSAEVAALNNLARIEAEGGDLGAALQAAERALARGEAYGDTHRTAALHDNLADLLHRAGRDEEAQEHQRQAAAMFAVVDRDEQRRPEIWQLVEW